MKNEEKKVELTIEVDEKTAENLKKFTNEEISELVEQFMKRTIEKQDLLKELAASTKRRDDLFNRVVVLLVTGRINLDTAKFLVGED